MIEVVTDIDRLRELALDQHGFVTRKQALAEGVSASSVDQLLHRERIERMGHGVYRVPQIPVTPQDSLQLALLWTGRDDAVLSHETALDSYDVCDIIADAIHVCVPHAARISRAGGDWYVLHKEDLPQEDITWWEGMAIVTPARAIAQCIDYGTPTYLLKQAIDQADARGLLFPEQRDNLYDRLLGRS